MPSSFPILFLSRIIALGIVFLFVSFLSLVAEADSPSKEETEKARQWIGTRFMESHTTIPAGPGLYVVANNDSVQKSSRHGKPLNLAGKTIAKGLYCHAFSRIVVHSDDPVENLRALIGVDSNEQTSGGRGSVVFIVKKIESTDAPSKAMLLGELKETEIFRSEKLVEGAPAVSIDLFLGGARNFVLEVEDAGDGISCDQADWADIRIVSKDSNKSIRLDELPFRTIGPDSCTAQAPFSFSYGGVSSFELLQKWKNERKHETIDEHRVRHTLTWTDPDTKLVVTCEAIEYTAFPTIEWVVRFKNTGTQNTPILSDVRSVDIGMEPTVSVVDHPWQRKNQGAHFETGSFRGNYTLHHAPGSHLVPEEFEPRQSVLRPDMSKAIATSGGRSSRAAMPYFNLQRNQGDGGLIVVVGWPGQWSMNFSNEKNSGMRISGGQEKTHFTLHPDEEVRTPLTVLQFWSGNDRIRSQNVWRRWMLAFGTPQRDGKPVPPHFAACSSHQYNEMINATDKTQIEMIDRYLAEGIKLDYWWMDAGWYVMKNTNRWPETGTWEVDRKRFPNGLRTVSDHAHAKGVKTILWFEPERVHNGTWLTENHPEWVLGGAGGGLLDLGDPEAWKWLVDHIDKILTEEKIDLYRQDFNMDPLGFWRGNDAPDRQGITEIKHVTGYLAYWDELLRRHPGLLIDTCASGGNRLDLETLRRSVPLLRSDFLFNPESNQGQTYGLSFWIPLFGTGEIQSGHSALFGAQTAEKEPYKTRSALMSFINSCTDVRVPADPQKNLSGSADYPNVRRYFEDWKRAAPFFYGDFHPLTPYSLDHGQWIAWQFHCPVKNESMIQIFRRNDSPYEAARYPLHGLDPETEYSVEDIDRGPVGIFTGRDLTENGLHVSVKQKPGAEILFLRPASAVK